MCKEQCSKMVVVFWQYVFLCYALVLWGQWKRWYRRAYTGGGRRTLKRLRQCAPQLLRRSERQYQQCLHFLELWAARRHWLHYGFCYYYGGHARDVVSWTLAAVTLYCLWNDLHAASKVECHFWSLAIFSGMVSAPVWHGHWIALMFSMCSAARMMLGS